MNHYQKEFEQKGLRPKSVKRKKERQIVEDRKFSRDHRSSKNEISKEEDDGYNKRSNNNERSYDKDGKNSREFRDPVLDRDRRNKKYSKDNKKRTGVDTKISKINSRRGGRDKKPPVDMRKAAMDQKRGNNSRYGSKSGSRRNESDLKSTGKNFKSGSIHKNRRK